MSNILDIQSTTAYIKACADQVDLNVQYLLGITNAYVRGRDIIIPELNSSAGTDDLCKLRSFVANVVASKQYSGTALEDAGYSYEGEDAALAQIYNAVEGTRVQRIASRQYAGDQVALTEGHVHTVAETLAVLDRTSPEEIDKLTPLLATCAMAEEARSDFDPNGPLNAEQLLKASPAAQALLEKAKDAGLVANVQDVASSQDSLDVAKAIYELIEGNPPPPPQGGSGEGDGYGNGESGSGEQSASVSGAGKEEGEAASALRKTMQHTEEESNGEPVGPCMEYTEPSSGAFSPCLGFDVVHTYKGEVHPDADGTSRWIDDHDLDAGLKSSRILSRVVRRLFQVKAHKFYRGGLKSGKLHGRNLSRAAFPSESYAQRVFRKKQDNDTLDTAVSLLVDFSGSMAHDRITTACAGAGLLSSTLTTLGMSNEIIGFTERGKRCVQYIIKPFNLRMPEHEVVNSFKTAGRLLCMNNDGDSLLWTYERLKTRTEKRKVLIVLSDGQPASHRVGDSSSYLKQVVKEIEQEGIVDIVGIGIECNDVKRYYSTNYVVQYATDLPDAILNTIKRKIL